MKSRSKNLLIVSAEPAPYNVDLYNSFADSHEWIPFVLYRKERDWSNNAGHDFRDLPKTKFIHTIVHGKIIRSAISGLVALFRTISKFKPHFTIVSGYKGAVPLAAIFSCVLTRRPFAIFADWFNTDRPIAGGVGVFVARRILRKIIFDRSSLVLTCGREGVASATRAGCPPQKVVNFPYVVDADRLRSTAPNEIPDLCLGDLSGNKIVIMFSGRHIARKGLPTLFSALASFPNRDEWVLWVEGDGPSRSEYETLADTLEIRNNCRFLGFCQMDLHSWLICNSDIVVIPSLHDAWGIVVDEGMQVGKVVCASNTVNSALDRIVHGENGFLFNAGNSEELANLLTMIIAKPELRKEIGLSALITAKEWTPKRNVEVFTRSLAAHTNSSAKRKV